MDNRRCPCHGERRGLTRRDTLRAAAGTVAATLAASGFARNWAAARDATPESRALPDLTGVMPLPLEGARLAAFEAYIATMLAELGVPEEDRREPSGWDGWTAGLVRQGWELVARAAKLRPDRLLAWAVEDRWEVKAQTLAAAERLQEEVEGLQRQMEAQAARRRSRRLLPPAGVLDKVTRYEAHLSRQVLQALHTLEP